MIAPALAIPTIPTMIQKMFNTLYAASFLSTAH